MKNTTPNFDFSAVIANSIHDMKNSVAMLLSGLDELIVQSPQGDPPVNQGFMELQYQGKRVNAQLVQLLALYRIRNDLYSPNITEIDVAECLEECSLQNKGLLALKGISLEVSCDTDLFWFFDRSMILSVINSQVNNAFKYTRSRVVISANIQDGHLCIDIHDDGSGYPEEMLQNAGADQRTIDMSTSSTGLGLYFATLVAQMHTNKGKSGNISLSNKDAGGRFRICLP